MFFLENFKDWVGVWMQFWVRGRGGGGGGVKGGGGGWGYFFRLGKGGRPAGREGRFKVGWFGGFWFS